MPEEKENGKKGLSSRQETPELRNTSLGRSWFFGIGINRYREFPTLNNAVKDVEDIRDLLIGKYDLDQDRSFLLRDDQATRENIMEQLDQLTTLIGNRDKLLIYYSGHGHLNNTTGLGYWIPHDAKKQKTAQYILNSTIRDYIRVIPSRHTLLISDACFSGSLFVRGGQRSGEALNELETIPSRWALCSGRHDEQVYDGIPGQNSPFAASILEVLHRNRKPSINILKLIDRVVDQTRANYRQLPEGNPLFDVGHKGGQYVFRTRAAATVEKMIDRPPETSGTSTRQSYFTDPRDGIRYRTVELNGQTWLAENLRFETEASWYFDDEKSENDAFGRLYHWEAAQRACPPGWRLPTDEEWQELFLHYGGYFDWESGKEKGDPEKAYDALGEGSAFNALLGGFRQPDGVYYSLGASGNYWSSTAVDKKNAWCYNFDLTSGKVYRLSNLKTDGLSCRCILDRDKT